MSNEITTDCNLQTSKIYKIYSNVRQSTPPRGKFWSRQIFEFTLYVSLSLCFQLIRTKIKNCDETSTCFKRIILYTPKRRRRRKKKNERINRKELVWWDRFETFVRSFNRITRANELDDFELKIIARNRNYRFANCHGGKLISAGITGPRLLITVHQLTVTNGFFVNSAAGVIADTRVRVISGYGGTAPQQ